MTDDLPEPTTAADPDRVAALTAAALAAVHRRTDRLFAWLLAGQWAFAVGLAVWVSRSAGPGHPHVWAAAILGGAFAAVPIGFARFRPGRVVTRHLIAVGQMLMSALLIHLTGGRIETHFHVIGSLAFLSFYKDWRVLVTATAVTVADHFVHGVVWPESASGTAAGSALRWAEHTAWIAFIAGFLVYSCRAGVRDVRAVAVRAAALDAARRSVARQVEERTAELRASEETFRGALDHAPIGMALVTPDGRYVRVNPAFCRMLGYTEAELLARAIPDISHPDDHARNAESRRRLLAGEVGTFTLEMRYLHKTGHVVPAMLSASLVRGPDGRPRYFVGQVQDITERKRAEAAAAADEAWHRAAQAAMLDLIGRPAGLPGVGQILEVAARTLGVEQVSVWHVVAGGADIRCGWLYERSADRHSAGLVVSAAEFPEFFRVIADEELIVAHDAWTHPRTAVYRDQYLEPRGITSTLAVPLRSRGQGGGVLIADHVGPARVWTAGEEVFALAVAGLVSLAVEETERSAAVESLRASEERFRSAFDHAAIGMVLIDAAGRFQAVNRAMADLVGHTPAELSALRLRDITHPDDLAANLDEFGRVVRGEIPFFRMEKRYVRKDGRTVMAQTTVSGVRVAGGPPTQLIAQVEDITARKAAETELRASREFIQEVLDSLSAHIAVLDPAGRIIAVNAAWYRFARANGGSQSQCGIGMNYLDICRGVGPARDPSEPVAAGIAAVLAGTADRFTHEYSCHAPDALRWFAIDVTPLRTGAVVAHLNITARMLAEAERDRLFTDSLMLLCVGGYDGHFRRVNPVWEATFGFTTEEYLSRPLLDFAHPDDRDRTAAEIALVAGGANVRGFENRVLCKDGSFRWVSWSATPFDGAAFYATGLDITDRKLSADDLARTRGLLIDAIESLDAGFVMYDSDERFIVCNTAYRKFYPECAHEMNPGTPYEVILRAYVAAGRHAHTGLSADEWVARRLANHRNPHGIEEQWLGDRWVRVSDRRTKAGGTVSLRTDVTNLKLAQEAAEAANRAKGEFLANMSHEIRTPLNGVLGMTELALRTDPTPEIREYLTVARQSARALLDVINDILDFSKIDAGKLDLDPAPFVVRDLVGEVAQTLAAAAHAKDLEFVADVDPEVPPEIVADPARIRQVLTNLAANAVKFTERGEVVVRVGRVPGDKSRLRYTVADTGIGIPAEKHAVIFDPFTQADGSTTRRFGGTGLGLAISARLVRLMGGAITLASEPGRGSTFAFDLPFDRVGGSSAYWAARPPAGVTGAVVLIADDNATAREMLDRCFRAWGGRPTAVASGAAALAELRRAADARRPYRIVVVDAKMPDVDGYAVADTAARDALTDGPVILLATGPAARTDGRLLPSGVSAVVAKPVRTADLHRTLARALAVSGVTPPADPRFAPSIRRLRVLVAEDNAVNQTVARRLLEKSGHSVVVANHGGEAVAAFERERFDLVLMDVQMPELDGFAATRAIRQRETGRERTPIVAMTAHAMAGDRERCIAAGMDDYIPKPIPLDDLARVLTWAAEVTRPGAAVEPPPDLDTALARIGGDQALFAELVALFVQDAPERLAEILRAVAAGDAAGLGRAAHTLKGSAGYLGGSSVADAARAVEKVAASGDLSSAASKVAALDAAVARLLAALSAHTASRPGA